MITDAHGERLEAVLDVLRADGARSVLDLGCGEGALLMRLAEEPGIARIVGVDQSAAALRVLEHRLRQAPGPIATKVALIRRSFVDRAHDLAEFDAAVLVETIEHIAPDRLSVLERAVFAGPGPPLIIVTTPNADFNDLLGVPRHRFRHPDHRFEWGRDRFRAWAQGVARRVGCRVDFADVAGRHPRHGGSTQMATFRRVGDGCDRTGGHSEKK